jgi:hypothetical protein
LTGDGERLDYVIITSVLNAFSRSVSESTNRLPAGEIRVSVWIRQEIEGHLRYLRAAPMKIGRGENGI